MRLAIEPEAPASEEQIAAVETELGVRLPVPYRNWLKQTNGCLVGEYTRVPGVGEGTFSEIDAVEALPSINRSSLNDLIPDDFLQLTISFGGSLAIKINGDDQGSVWWASSWKAEVDGILDEPSREIMFRLADDWDAFLALDFPEPKVMS
ncbi:SMI1/KNR4 family protein [Microlunatus parietis]|uniref:Cell wall assembly regulator SMI1 n=1 Tax=Microlunatus parietis TaxID=682979 RepID=A0A7Y9ICB1_9ACTN|nr:SMI1/KNR4 family protein [Microlunatus parietis]NYE73971.1 cell wall assembly regulator SMI1 [Microlunatus parietis]